MNLEDLCMSTFHFFEVRIIILGKPFTKDYADVTLSNLNSYSDWVARYFMYHTGRSTEKSKMGAISGSS